MATVTNSTNITLSTGQNLPVPQSPFVDPKTGVLSNDGYMYLLGLINQLSAALPTYSVALGLGAKGATQATALALQAQWNEIDNQTNGNGVILAALQPGQSQTVFNQSGGAINVYPPPSFKIDAGAVNIPFSLGSGLRQAFDFMSSTQIRSGD